jgi:cytochrome c peroxidase
MRTTLSRVFFFFVMSMAFFLQACGDEDPVVAYDPTPYELSFGDFPPPMLQPDNLPTQAGVQLGRMLFYEKKLSRDNTQACADCHQQKDMFSDIRQFSIGVDQLRDDGRRWPCLTLPGIQWYVLGWAFPDDAGSGTSSIQGSAGDA